MIPFSCRAHTWCWHLPREVTTNLRVSHKAQGKQQTCFFFSTQKRRPAVEDAPQYANRASISRRTQPRHTNQARRMKFEWFLAESSAQRPLCGPWLTLQTQISLCSSASERRTRRDRVKNGNDREAASPLANLTDSHDVGADVPDKSNRPCRFRRTMIASASDSPEGEFQNKQRGALSPVRIAANTAFLSMAEKENEGKLERSKLTLKKRWTWLPATMSPDISRSPIVPSARTPPLLYLLSYGTFLTKTYISKLSPDQKAPSPDTSPDLCHPVLILLTVGAALGDAQNFSIRC